MAGEGKEEEEEDEDEDEDEEKNLFKMWWSLCCSSSILACVCVTKRHH